VFIRDVCLQLAYNRLVKLTPAELVNETYETCLHWCLCALIPALQMERYVGAAFLASRALASLLG
jgi:hypothetical protein